MAEEADTMAEDVGEVADGAEAAGELVYPGLASLGLEDTEQVKIDMNKIRGSLDDCNAVCRTVGARHTSRSDVATGWLVTGLVVSLAVLSSVPGGHAAKPRPQREVPYFPWQEGIPGGRDAFGMVTAADGSVWLFGGMTNSGVTDELHKLDPHERRWHDMKTSGPWPSARYHHTMVALNGSHALLFGGETRAHQYSNELWLLDMTKASWTPLVGSDAAGPWPSARMGHSMVALNSTCVLVFGGFTVPPPSPVDAATFELWALDVTTLKWTLMDTAHVGEPGPRPTHHQFNSMVVVNRTRVLMFGGLASGPDSDELWALDMPNAKWTLLVGSGATGPRPSRRYEHSMVALNSTRVLMFGGNSQPQSDSDELWELDVPTAKWTVLQYASPKVGDFVVCTRGDDYSCHPLAAVCNCDPSKQGVLDSKTHLCNVRWEDGTLSLHACGNLELALQTGVCLNSPGGREGHRMVALNSTRVLMFGGSVKNELWSLDLPTGDHSVCWTLLNLVNVTAEELSGQFNTPQVCVRAPQTV